MYVRAKPSKRGTPLFQVVESRRHDGQPRQEVLAHLGWYASPTRAAEAAAAAMFWHDVLSRLHADRATRRRRALRRATSRRRAELARAHARETGLAARHAREQAYATNRWRVLSELPRDLAAPEDVYVALWKAWAERNGKANLPWAEPPRTVPSPTDLPLLRAALQQARPAFRIDNAAQLERVTAAITRADWGMVRHLVALDVWKQTQAAHGVELTRRPVQRPLPVAEDKSLGDLWAREVMNGDPQRAARPPRSSRRRRSPTA